MFRIKKVDSEDLSQPKEEIDNIKAASEKLNNRASEYLKDKNKLRNLLSEAEKKAKGHDKKGFVQETWDSLKTMFELIKAYIKGDYRNIPYMSLLYIIGAILYFVMPVDAIPDALIALGYTDDATVIVLTAGKVKKDLEKFIAWKKANEQSGNE